MVYIKDSESTSVKAPGATPSTGPTPATAPKSPSVTTRATSGADGTAMVTDYLNSSSPSPSSSSSSSSSSSGGEPAPPTFGQGGLGGNGSRIDVNNPNFAGAQSGAGSGSGLSVDVSNILVPLWLPSQAQIDAANKAYQAYVKAQGNYTGGSGSPQAWDNYVSGGGVTGSTVGDAEALWKKLQAAATPTMLNEDQMDLAFGSILLDQSKLDIWRTVAVKAGLVTTDQSYDANKLFEAWKQVVHFTVADAYNHQNDKNYKPLTPVEMAIAIAQHNANIAQGTTGAPGTAKDTFTGDRWDGQTTTVDLTKPADAYKTLHDALGRNPTDQELAAFNTGWETAARQHPQVETVMGHYVSGNETSKTSTWTGGYDKTKLASDLIQADPAVARYQQATTYFDALKQALGAAVTLGG